jgi:TnpA family transposase
VTGSRPRPVDPTGPSAPRVEQDYGPFNQLLTERINTRVIVDNWDEVLRLAASIRHGTVSAALIMRKLAAYPRQNQIARALNEVGQLEKTVFILELLLDPQLRRRQERGLNDGEAVNSASRAIFVGQRGEFRDRAYQDQVHRASCLHLLVAAIGAWTTPTWLMPLRLYVQKAKTFRMS